MKEDYHQGIIITKEAIPEETNLEDDEVLGKYLGFPC